MALPLDDFPAWARLNDVSLRAIELQEIPEKGSGFVLNRDVKDHQEQQELLLKVSRDLVLSSEAVQDYAKVNSNFKQLLEATGHQSTRLNAMLFLLCHLAHSRTGHSASSGNPSAPWTEYIRFLPLSIPVPTLWTEPERLLLKGTSLESALGAKLAALTAEFDHVRDATESMPFWNELLWERRSISLTDWMLIDAWYRSRCLELPRFGDAMVPGLDMVNHSSHPTAYYEVDEDGNVVLLPRPGCDASCGQEVTISYGEAKSAAEMLFSYGFVENDNTSRGLTLTFDPMSDDPLAKAKMHVFDRPRTVTISQEDHAVTWECPFAYLACLNEEDGLDFRLLQDTAGDRQLRLFWQDQDVTDQAAEFETLIEGHPLFELFKLRVVALLLDLVESHLSKIQGGIPDDQLQPLIVCGLLRHECIASARVLCQHESTVLESAAQALQNEKSTLLAHDNVVAYLGSMEDDQNEEAPREITPNNDDDFS